MDALNALAESAASPPVEPPPALRDRILASRARPGRFGIFADRIARLFDLPVPEAEALLKRIESPAEWQPFLVPGTTVVPFVAGPKCEGAMATIISIPAGTVFPEHTHRGDETMVVLDGGFVEPGTKREVWRGEEVTRLDGSTHQLVALPGTACIAASLNRGHVDFT